MNVKKTFPFAIPTWETSQILWPRVSTLCELNRITTQMPTSSNVRLDQTNFDVANSLINNNYFEYELPQSMQKQHLPFEYTISNLNQTIDEQT